MSSTSSSSPRIGLALSGGGPMGAIYEIGALCALEESLNGIDFTKLQHYVGVSAGGFIAAGLANGFTPRQLCSLFIENKADGADAFDPAWLLTPAYGEFARRAVKVPGLLLSSLWHMTAGGQTLTHALERLGPMLPTGIFSNSRIHSELTRLFSTSGRTNDFRQLKTQLTLVATNLDSGQAVQFGRPGWDHIPISKAVQASAALPGLFPPVEIENADFVDGALIKTMHASVALDAGVDLMLCLNPLVPFNATAPKKTEVMRRGLSTEKHHIPKIVDGGLPAVLSQTFRSMIHSRMVLGMKQYEHLFPQTDIILFEPDQRDPELYLANTFSYSRRRQLAEHAYQQTRHMLRSRKTGLSAKLWQHGITLHHQALDDPHRHLSGLTQPKSGLGRSIGNLQEIMDDLDQLVTSQNLSKGDVW